MFRQRYGLEEWRDREEEGLHRQRHRLWLRRQNQKRWEQRRQLRP